MEKLAVNGGSGITARQWRDFWEKVELNKITSGNFQKYLDNPDSVSNRHNLSLISLTKAKKILGRSKILTVVNYNKIWGTRLPESAIGYSELVLDNAAWQNRRDHDWRLIYYGGSAIVMLRNILGMDQACQPCFSHEWSDWYLREQERSWIIQTQAPGYYLINFKGQLKNLNYEEQEKQIKLSSPSYERTDPHVFAEAIFSIFKLSGERVATSWDHWTSVRTYGNAFVRLGHFDFEGLKVRAEQPGIRNHEIRVSVCLKPRQST